MLLTFRGEELWNRLRSGFRVCGLGVGHSEEFRTSGRVQELLEMQIVPQFPCFPKKAIGRGFGRYRVSAMYRKTGIKRGDLVAVLNPSLLPKAGGSDARAATVENEDQILLVQAPIPKPLPQRTPQSAVIIYPLHVLAHETDSFRVIELGLRVFCRWEV